MFDILLSFLYFCLLSLVFVFVGWHIYIRLVFWQAFIGAPGECRLITGWIPFIGVGLDYGNNPPAYLAAAQKKYGDVFSFIIFGQRFTYLLHSLNHALVFKSTTKFFTTSPVVHSITKLVAQHQIPYEKEVEINQLFWTHLQPTNLIEPLAKMANVLADRFQQRGLIINNHNNNDNNNNNKNKNQTGSTKSNNLNSEGKIWGLYQLTKECMFSAACEALFGDDSSNERDLPWQLDEFDILDSTFVPIAAGLPSLLPSVAKGHKAIDRLGKHFGRGRLNRIQMLEEREKLARAHTDDLSNQRLSVAFLWAAQTNTIPGSFWCWYRILKDEKAQIAILDEWKEVMKANGHPLEKNGRINIVIDVLKQLAVLDSALYEAMRLCSSANCFRVAVNDMRLNVYDRDNSGVLITRPLNIRKKDWVLVVPQLAHFDTQLYPTPNEYIYDRFVVKHSLSNSNPPVTGPLSDNGNGNGNDNGNGNSPDKDSENREKPSVVGSSCAINLSTGSVSGSASSQFLKNGEVVRYPCVIFGGGMDICPGRHFSFNELRIFILTVLYHIEIKFVDENTEVKLDDSRPSIGVVPPKIDPKVTVRPRVH